MQMPYLSLLIFTPLVAGILLLCYPAQKRSLIRGTALAAALITLALSVFLFLRYDVAAAGYQFMEKMDWLPSMGISYFVGVDGISVAMELMAGLVVLSGVLVSWNIEDRPREFFAFLMFLAASVFGVFASLDLFQLFFFFELAVYPR
jgi:NADH-quinone oxidoreductase subunit M